MSGSGASMLASIPERSVTLDNLPYDVILHILSFLLEQDVCRVSEVCKRLNAIANGIDIWKILYRNLYHYDLPLMVGPDPREFYFHREPANKTDPDAKPAQQPPGVFPGMQFEPWTAKPRYLPEAPPDGPLQNGLAAASGNVWKEVFVRLSRAVHVRPGFEGAAKARAGRSTKYFATIDDAYLWCKSNERSTGADIPIIFVHPGRHILGRLAVKTPVIILGCGPSGNPAQNIIIEYDDKCDSYIQFKTRDHWAYLGYVSLEFTPAAGVPGPLYVYKDSKALIIDHCIIRSPFGSGIIVFDHSEPLVRYCDISDCHDYGILIYGPETIAGTYENNRISRCGSGGVWLNKGTDPVLRENTFDECEVEVKRAQQGLDDL